MGSATIGERFVFFVRDLWVKGTGLLKSRKFWAGVTATVVTLQDPGLDPQTKAQVIGGVWAVFILGVAIEDGLRSQPRG